MNKTDLDHTISRWTRLGVLFGSRPARTSPDIERLLLDTARLAPSNARLFYLAVTWLSQYGNFVVRHRLKRLVETQLAHLHQPTLAALLGLAVKHGASKELQIAAEACHAAGEAGPLFEVHHQSRVLADLARRSACPEGLRWNLWLPDEPPKLDALRPAHWVIKHNPSYIDRIVRRGDLRASILLTLQQDVPDGNVDSETALARLCSANRIAIRHALDDLEHEGYILRQSVPGIRNIRISLTPPARPLAAG